MIYLTQQVKIQPDQTQMKNEDDMTNEATTHAQTFNYLKIKRRHVISEFS